VDLRRHDRHNDMLNVQIDGGDKVKVDWNLFPGLITSFNSVLLLLTDGHTDSATSS
jgi:hypothetical protein